MIQRRKNYFINELNERGEYIKINRAYFSIISQIVLNYNYVIA